MFEVSTHITVIGNRYKLHVYQHAVASTSRPSVLNKTLQAWSIMLL